MPIPRQAVNHGPSLASIERPRMFTFEHLVVLVLPLPLVVALILFVLIGGARRDSLYDYIWWVSVPLASILAPSCWICHLSYLSLCLCLHFDPR
jgi:hypothetical protein